MSKLDEIRAWPQRKKMNLIWITTGAAVLIMVGLWILIGNYRTDKTQSASGTFGTIVNNINKDSNKGK